MTLSISQKELSEHFLDEILAGRPPDYSLEDFQLLEKHREFFVPRLLQALEQEVSKIQPDEDACPNDALYWIILLLAHYKEQRAFFHTKKILHLPNDKIDAILR